MAEVGGHTYLVAAPLIKDIKEAIKDVVQWFRDYLRQYNKAYLSWGGSPLADLVL